MAIEKKPGEAAASQPAERPEIYGIRRAKGGAVLDRRSFLGAVAASGVLAACGLPTAEGEAARPGKSKSACHGPAHDSPIKGLLLAGEEHLYSWDTKACLKQFLVTRGRMFVLRTLEMLRQDAKDRKEGVATEYPGFFLDSLDSDLTLAFARAPDGQTLALTTDDNRIALWKAETEVADHFIKGTVLPSFPFGIPSFAFHPDGALLLSTEPGSVVFWDVERAKPVKTMLAKGPGPRPPRLAVSPDGLALFGGYEDGTVRTWELPSGRAGEPVPCHGAPIADLRVTPAGQAVTLDEAGEIKLWDLPLAAPRSWLDPHPPEKISAIDVSPDGQLLATGTADGNIYLWRLPQGSMMGCLFDWATIPDETQTSFYRQPGARSGVQPCQEALPPDAACVCDCVGANRLYHAPDRGHCACDTIAVPSAYQGEGACACDTLAAGRRDAAGGIPPNCGCVADVNAAPDCGCVDNVVFPPNCGCVADASTGPGGGSGHYWRPD
jgi:WD40 repeat protein